MSRPSITLYTPCYDAAPYLDRVLPALRTQSLAPAEILLVDDDSAAIASRHGVRVLRHPSNRGLAAARNTAFREARGEWVAAVDADVAPEPRWLEHLAARLQGDPGLAGVGGTLRETVVSPYDRWRDAHMRQSWGDDPIDDIHFLFGANTLFRREAVLAVGGYDERNRTNGEDGDISRKLREAGHRLAYEPAAICQHLRRDDFASLSRTAWNWRFVDLPDGSWADLRKRDRKIRRTLRRRLWADLRAGRPLLAAIDARMYVDWQRRNWRQFRERRAAASGPEPTAA